MSRRRLGLADAIDIEPSFAHPLAFTPRQVGVEAIKIDVNDRRDVQRQQLRQAQAAEL